MEEEKLYLEKTLNKIDDALGKIRRIINNNKKQVDYLSEFYADQYYSMDEEEAAVQRVDIDSEEQKLKLALEIEQKLLISQQSPYFGRIDFLPDDETFQKIYIGIMGVIDKGNTPLVCDWRAPVSSMFYDYGKGRAKYTAPFGIIEGNIELKRQYKIKNQKMEYYFDSDINIDDEILQESLSANRSEKLSNIVSTIQTEQNKIIRNEEQKNMLVQGYAGSGKTTVALHRAAYLLYRYKNNLTSDNIVFISPSNMFSDYISDVLPELGENTIPQITFEGLAGKYLKEKIEKREEMFERIIKDNECKQVVCFKESFDFCENLMKYLQLFAQSTFKAKDFVFGKQKIEKEKIERLYFENYKEKDISVRIDWIADFVCDELEFDDKQRAELKDRVVKILYSYFYTTDVYEIYNDFLCECGLATLDFVKINFDDLAPLVYIKGYLFGFDVQKETKHLIVDEMQDYSPLHFKIFEKIYPCPKTVVGDIYQSLYKDFESDYLDKLSNLIGDCKLIFLNKTYRSTRQINDFAFSLIPNNNVEPFNRNGEEVSILVYDQNSFKNILKQQIQELSQKYNKIAVITKTNVRAKAIFMVLDDERMTFDEDTLTGFPILSIAQSRGLEFDAVVTVLDNPVDKISRSALFVGSTRALHKLVVLTQE